MPNHDRFECQTVIDLDAILHLDSFKSKNNCKSFETNPNLLDKNGKPVEIMVCDDQELHFFVPKN